MYTTPGLTLALSLIIAILLLILLFRKPKVETVTKTVRFPVEMPSEDSMKKIMLDMTKLSGDKIEDNYDLRTMRTVACWLWAKPKTLEKGSDAMGRYLRQTLNLPRVREKFELN